MIYLIGGTPRCGKTTLAKLIGKKKSYSYIQTDYIASAIQSKLSDDLKMKLFGEKRNDNKNRINTDTRFSSFSNTEQLEFYLTKAKRSRDGIKNIIDYSILDNEDIVLEGFHLRPSLISQELENRGDKVRYIALYKSNKEEIEQGIKSNKHPNDRATKSTYQEETYPKIASFVYDFGQVIKNEAEENGLETFDMSKGNFRKNLENVYGIITSK